jgi:hypothetical protein
MVEKAYPSLHIDDHHMDTRSGATHQFQQACGLALHRCTKNELADRTASDNAT